jgi:hypothetical protein
MLYKDNEYILYVSDDANFQTKSILIPAHEFIKIRLHDYNLLKENSIQHTVIFKMYFYTHLKITTLVYDNELSK